MCRRRDRRVVAGSIKTLRANVRKGLKLQAPNSSLPLGEQSWGYSADTPVPFYETSPPSVVLFVCDGVLRAGSGGEAGRSGGS